jgi:hypothetical protein
VEAEVLDQFPLRAFGHGDHSGVPVEDRRETLLEETAETGEARRQRHLPHLAVDMMVEDHVRASGPQR